MLQSEYRIWFKKKVSSSPPTEPELNLEHCLEESIEEQIAVPEDCVNILKNSPAPSIPEKYKLQSVNQLSENIKIEDVVQKRIERELEEFKVKQAIDPLSYKQLHGEKTFSIAKASKLPSSVPINIPIIPSEEPIQEPVDSCLFSPEPTSKTTSKLPFDFQEPMVNEILNSFDITNATKRINFSKILKEDQKPASQIASPNNKLFTSPRVKQPKSSSRNFSRIFWPVLLVSNLFLFVGQIHLFHSLDEFKKFDNKRFERLQAKMNLYQQKFQRQLDEISIKGKEIVAPLFADNHSIPSKMVYIPHSQKPKQIVSHRSQGSTNSTSTLQLPQRAPIEAPQENKVEDSVANNSDEGFSVIKPREEAEKPNQFSILTDSEYTQYQTTVKRRQAADKKKISSYNQLFEQSKNLYSKREVKEQ